MFWRVFINTTKVSIIKGKIKKKKLNMLDKVFPRSFLSLLVFVLEVIKVLIINLKKEFNQAGFLGFNLSPNNYLVIIHIWLGWHCSVLSKKKQNEQQDQSVMLLLFSVWRGSPVCVWAGPQRRSGWATETALLELLPY